MYAVTEQIVVRLNGELKVLTKPVCYITDVNKQTLDELTDALYEIHNVYIIEIINLCNGRYELRTDDKYFSFVIEALPTVEDMLEEYREFTVLDV